MARRKKLPILILLAILTILFPINGSALDSTNISSPMWSKMLGQDNVPVTCSDNGSFIVAGSDTGNLQLFDKTGNIIRGYSTNGSHFTSVSISGDGKIFSGTADGGVVVFDDKGKLLLNYSSGISITRSALSRSGGTVISSRDGGLQILDQNGNVLGLSIQPGAIWDVAISDDGQYGVAAVDLGWQTRKGKIVVIDHSGSKVVDYPTMSQGVGVAISDNGSSIVGIDDYNLYSIFRNGTLRWSFPSSPPFRDVAITSDGKYIVAGSQYYIRVFNETGSLLWENQESGYIYSVAISEDGEYIIAGSSDQVRLFDKSGNLLWHYNHGSSNVATSKNGEYFAVGTNNEIKYFNKWGNETTVDEPNAPVKNNYPNNSTSPKVPSTSKPAPLSSIAVIGALFCISGVASFSKKFLIK